MKRKFHVAAIVAAIPLLHSPIDGGAAHAAGAGYKEKKLYDFCKQANCADGTFASGNVVIDPAGNIYGTTEFGGVGDRGVVFKLTPHGRKYNFAAIYTFGVSDSLSTPTGDLSLDKDGNLYGTTFDDSMTNCGAVFELSPNGASWVLSIPHRFAGGADGCHPTFGLTYAGKNLGKPWDEFSPLFGTASEGGAHNSGVAYELVSDGSLWNETVIHTFDTALEPGALLEDSLGNLWGTTQFGGDTGSGGDGLLFKLAAGTWKETVAYHFCSLANCADGLLPAGRLFMDGSGNLFGTTFEGGTSANCVHDNGCGVVFELSSGGSYQVLYNFCAAAQCADGELPGGGVILNPAGALVGMTGYGGSGKYNVGQFGAGVAFELRKSGSAWSETVDHDFCSKRGCKDGDGPASDPVMDASGQLFGVTNGGGETDGNVFELKPK